MKRVLTLVGDPNLINTHSNIPYCFLKAGQDLGFLDSGLALKPEKLRFYRPFWNMCSFIRTGGIGGFQYSEFFLRRLFNQIHLDSEPLEVISYFNLLPPPPWKKNWKVSYYIECTLLQLFGYYDMLSRMHKNMKEEIYKREKENYLKAERIICVSYSAAKSVIDDYRISPSKVHIIHLAANLTDACIDPMNVREFGKSALQPLRLGFIGKDWRRKGLSSLIKVAELLQKREIAVEVMAAGFSAKSFPRHPLVRVMGFIDKQYKMKEFIQLVRSFHFGCLFSSAEIFGIFPLECLRLGVPVLATRIAGLAEAVPEGLGYLFEPNSLPEEAANILEYFVQHPAEYYELRNRIELRTKEFTWERVIRDFIRVWQGSEEYRYKEKYKEFELF